MHAVCRELPSDRDGADEVWRHIHVPSYFCPDEVHRGAHCPCPKFKYSWWVPGDKQPEQNGRVYSTKPLIDPCQRYTERGRQWEPKPYAEIHRVRDHLAIEASKDARAGGPLGGASRDPHGFEPLRG